MTNRRITEEDLDARVQSAWFFYSNTVDHMDRHSWVSCMADMIDNMPKVHSGMMSKACIGIAKITKKDGRHISNLTDDHYYSRHSVSKKLYDDWKSGVKLSEAEFKRLFRKVWPSVHRVTQAENQELRKINKQFPDLTWEEQYEKVGIELCPKERKLPEPRRAA